VKQFLISVVASLTMTLVAAPSYAEQAKQPVRAELQALKITVNKDGKETAAEAKEARPGDLIEYRATYTNTSKKTISGLAATLPIPKDMQFTGTATPAGAEASTDGKTFAMMPLKRKVGDKVVDVPLADYRALRWRIAELPTGKSTVVTARTRVNGVNP
jgi:uncharacterized repeat protein (TIGR01451 family)